MGEVAAKSNPYSGTSGRIILQSGLPSSDLPAEDEFSEK
jgi:hypothetical protein